MPTVSTIIPTYNRAEFLADAVESVLDQTHEDLECIVVDGGSTDGTRAFLDSVDDERLLDIRREEPKGLSNARNAGLELASGEYVVFLDDDDRLYPNAVEVLLETLQDQPPDCAGVFTDQRQVEASGETTILQTPSGRAETFEANIGGPSCTIVRAEVIEEVGPFDETFPSLEDQEFWIRVFSKYHMYGLDRVLYDRHMHDGQMTAQPDLMIEGKRLVLEKHGETFTPSERANQHYNLSHHYAAEGRTATARSYVRRAILEHPYRLGFFYYYGWLLFGARGYDLGHELHIRVYRPLVDSLRAMVFDRGAVKTTR